MEKENWKDVPGYEGLYQVSDIGNVRSINRIVDNRWGSKTLRKGKDMKISDDNRGYLKCGLHKNSIHKTFKVHVVVAMAFLDHKPKGFEQVVLHKNSIKTDNSVENLQIISQRQKLTKQKIKKNKNMKNNIQITNDMHRIEKEMAQFITESNLSQDIKFQKILISYLIGINVGRIVITNELDNVRLSTEDKQEISSFIEKALEEKIKKIIDSKFAEKS